MEDYIYAVILGMVQGLTEFLPVSSSGHLFTAQFIINKFFSNGWLSFSADALPLRYVVLLHAATLCAVLLFTRTLIKNIASSCVRAGMNVIRQRTVDKRDGAHVRLMLMICISTSATVPPALLLKNVAENASLINVFIGWTVTVFELAAASLFIKVHASRTDGNVRQKSIMTIAAVQALIIGLAQGIAVFPGISRSGSTIAAGVLTGMSFVDAAYFSFLLAIPAVLGSFAATVMDKTSATADSIPAGVETAGVISAFIFGLIGLKLLAAVFQKNKLWIFSVYLIILMAVLALLLY